MSWAASTMLDLLDIRLCEEEEELQEEVVVEEEEEELDFITTNWPTNKNRNIPYKRINKTREQAKNKPTKNKIKQS